MFKFSKSKQQGVLSTSAARARRMLNVEVMDARNLLACEKKKGSSDPYCVCQLMDLGDRPIKSEVYNTQQKRGTLNPAFGETFTFGKVYDLDTTGELPSLKITLFHKAAMAISETPLGEVTVFLNDIDPTAVALMDRWYPIVKSGRMTEVSGEIHLRIRFTGPPTATMDPEANLEEYVEDPDTEDKEPNCLEITAVQGRGLKVMDTTLFSSGGTSDPFIRFRLEGFKDQQTAYIRKTINPIWNEKITFSPMLDGSLTLQVTVKDYNDIALAKFMGRIYIPLIEYADKKPKKTWFKLNGPEGPDGENRGEVELLIHWKFDVMVSNEMFKQSQASQSSIFGKLSGGAKIIGNALTGETADSDMDESEDDVASAEEATAAPAESPEEKEAREKAEADKRKELEDIDIKSGEYQVQVHIIEARDLKAENLDGTSDPITYVECFGQKQNTAVKYACTSCVYDELLIFNIKDLDKEQFKEGVIRIAVLDANSMPMMKQTMIGAFAVDATTVYTANKDHEMYRRWVPLMDDEDADDVGVQGYLKISISIIGPGDKLKVHDEDAEIAKEMAEENKAGGDIGSLVLSVPTIRKEWKFLVVSVYRCEALPVMDGKVGVGFVTASRAGTDAFCQVTFAGGKPLKTKVKTVVGETRAAINPVFNYELWYPISMPSMTQVIKFSVWDHDLDKNEMIGQFTERLNVVSNPTKSSSERIKWYNLYGAPEFKTESLISNIKKGVKAVGDAVNEAAGLSIDWQDYYNQVPDRASTFKGRVLCKFRMMDKRPDKYNTAEVKPFKLKIGKTARLTVKSEPRQTEYVLKALVVSGSEVPQFGDLNPLMKQSMQVRVSIGHHEACTKSVKNEAGTCRWNELLRIGPVKLPEDIEQMPDIFVYLLPSSPNKQCSFCRIKPYDSKTGQFLGFNGKAQWYLMEEDKVVNALKDDEFPGNLLIKLGFGRAVDADSTTNEWSRCLEDAKRSTLYQVRCHIYQGADIPAADANGLCDPYINVNFMGSKYKTDVRYKTLFPEYYQTIVMRDVNIPDANNFEYASQINFRVYDKDLFPKPGQLFNTDDYLGACQVPLTDAVKCLDPTLPVHDPKWYELFKEKPGDGQGRILVAVQLIPQMEIANKDMLDYKSNIIPETRDAWIEIIAVGIRDMAPFNFQAMVFPFLEIELNTIGTKYLQQTAPSKRPNPSNPNFVEKIVLPCKLPIKSIFATPLQLRARDTRLGGYLKPVVGVGTIDLVTKIPWCPETYIPPQTEKFFKPDEVNPLDLIGQKGAGLGLDDAAVIEDEVSMQTEELRNRRLGELQEDDFIVTQEQPNVESFVKRRMKDEDSGAGVFGALRHINTSGVVKKKAERQFVDPDWTQDDGDQPPKWSVNRRVLPSELEVEYKTTPFETYALTRGKKNGMLGSSLKVVGKFKGLVRVMLTEDEPSLLPKELLQSLLKPKGYKIRLYVLNAVGITAMDRDMFGKPAKSDPYLKVHLGKDKFDDRQNAVDDVTEVDLYKVIEFNAELPGTSQLTIDLMDKNDFRSDVLIGRTIIDLEDRWFDSRWQQEGRENLVLPSGTGKDSEDIRWETKPIECRSLYVPSNHNAQGTLKLWCDIMTPEVANAFPPDDVSLPPTQKFEVRVVIWKSRDVPPMDTFEGMSDLFVKVWPEGCDPQETDTHWRCKKGKGSWNWRLLFEVELGHSTRAMKFPYLHMQLWDRDLLKWSDCAGEAVIDLRRYYRKAYKKNIPLKLFEKKRGLVAKRAAAREGAHEPLKIVDTNADIPPEENATLASPAAAGDTSTSAAAASSDKGTSNPMLSGSNSETKPDGVAATNASAKKDRDSDDDDDEDGDAGVGAISMLKQREMSKAGLGSEVKAVGNKTVYNKEEMLKKAADKKAAIANGEGEAEPSKRTWREFFFGKAAPTEEEEGLLDDPNEKTEEEKKADDDEEVKDMVSTIKNMTGLFPESDPDDSDWMKISQKDHNTDKVTPMGSICYSIQIWPKEKSMLFPAGSGRNEPNTNPFLPPPVGRLKWSWNPFVLGSELCGPKLCGAFFCCLVITAFILLMVFAQPFLTLLINICFFFG